MHGSLQARRWKQAAFLGRYANQPFDVVMRMPVDDLQRLVRATAEILNEENESMKKRE